MKIASKNLLNGTLADAFGHRGNQFKHGMPSRSFHLSWSELPSGTVSLALFFDDIDATPVCGFSWIHWTVANLDPSLGELPENASETLGLLEGVNSWASPLAPDSWRLTREQATGYGGCAPPDKAHLYRIKAYALDSNLPLKRGFFANELFHAMEGHILAEAALSFWYPAKN